MRHFDAAAVEAATPYKDLIEAIGAAFRDGGTSPERHNHQIPTTSDNGTLLVMPSWSNAGYFGVKLATVYAGNAAKNLPTVNGIYALFDQETGTPLATFDAAMLTARRTAAASAFAASRLARADAESLLIVGTGRMSRSLIQAHCTTRSIQKIRVWGRSQRKAEALVADARVDADIAIAADLEAACHEADIISTATLAREPLVRGNWLKPGVHVDLVGAFSPDMREADSDLFDLADLIYVDTYEGARAEAGDILAAIDEGALQWGELSGSLHDLAAITGLVRRSDDEISVFKSVGTGLEDLAAARLCIE